MKKMIKRIAVFAMAAMMLLSLVSCGITSAQQAEATVGKMFDAYKSLDFEGVAQYVNVDQMTISSLDDAESTDYTMFMKALFDRLDYVIVSSEEVDEATVNVVADVTAIDIKPVLADYFVAAMQLAFGNAFSDDALSDEELDQQMEELFVTSASKEDLAVVTNQVTIQVTKTDDQWKVQPDDALVDAMLGGMIAAMESINDSLSESFSEE